MIRMCMGDSYSGVHFIVIDLTFLPEIGYHAGLQIRVCQ